MTNLSGHVGLVTGGLGDIGQAIARAFARGGADVAVSDILPEDRAANLLSEIQGIGARVRYDQVDVTDYEAVRAWVDRVDADLGTPDLIIPNAAIATLTGGVRTVTPEEWTRELRINLDGAFHLAHAGARRLLERGKPGRIVFIGSWAAHAAHPTIPAYCAAKAGLRMLAKCLALELAPSGILVNEVAPGFVDGGVSKRIFDKDPLSRDRARAKTPVGSLIEPDDVAREVAHLCDPETRQTVGSVVLMDGGLSLVTPGGNRDS